MNQPTTDYADLEIAIGRLEQGRGYPVHLRLNGMPRGRAGLLDAALLPWVNSYDPQADGETLFRWLLGDESLRRMWDLLRREAPQRRTRLVIDDAPPELHAVPWELLRDPGGDAPQDIAAGSATPFSRTLPVEAAPGAPLGRRPIKLLVAVANPQGLERYGLAPVNVDEEVSFIQQAIAGGQGDLELTVLPPPITLDRLADALREGYHGLHFVGHGIFRGGDAFLFLADNADRVHPVADQDVVAVLARQLTDRDPASQDGLRLITLAACQSATRDTADAWRGLAPQLVRAGVPAVLAMQDRVPVVTAQRYVCVFYHRLLRHGLVDLAANEARAAVLDAMLPGAQIPVLFMRLRNGQLLSRHGRILGDRGDSFWDTLLPNIAEGDCTPFLGPGVTAGLLPSPGELATELAARCHYPFPATQNLPRVTQFWSTKDNRRPRKEVVVCLISQFMSRMGLQDNPLDHGRSLSEIAEAADWSNHSQQLFGNEIHHQLADLGLPLYITTNFDNFMTLALRARAGQARRETVDWRQRARSEPGQPRHSLNPPPTRDNPVVFHLFGVDNEPMSMVLTEDDYLDYLACISKDYEYLLPTDVYEALASTTLLFLGYRLDDLDLKVILRGLLPNLDLQKWEMLHVAVQIESSAVDQATQEEVASYFQKYFAKSRIDVYWGSAQQFVADLYAHWQEYRHA